MEALQVTNYNSPYQLQRKTAEKLRNVLIPLLLIITVLSVTACDNMPAPFPPEFTTTSLIEETPLDEDLSADERTGNALHLQYMQEHLKFEHISIEQGLSQSTVFCILQDSKGFMWFGTEDGLDRYDGYSFKVYRHDPDNPNSINDNYVMSIYEDRSGFLWIGTLSGLDRFDRKTERLITIREGGVTSIHPV